MEVVTKISPKEAEHLKILDKVNLYINNFLAVLAGISLFSMMFLIVGNSIVRQFYVPYIGTVEVVGWLAALTAAFALGHTQRDKGHVVLDLLMEKLPIKVQSVVGFIVNLINIVFFSFVFYHLFLFSLELKTNGYVSETLVIAYYPFVILLAIGFFGLIFALIVDLVQGLKKEESQ